MKTAPGITQWTPLPIGHLAKLHRDLTGFQMQLRQRYGDIVRLRAGPILIHFLYHPEHVKRVFQDRQKQYQRGWQYRLLGRLLGQGMVVTDGDLWLRQRRLTQPAFHRQRLPGYVEMMADVTAEAVSRWEQLVGQPLDLEAEMSRLTLAIICRTMFGRIVSNEAEIVRHSFHSMKTYLEMRLNRPFSSLPVWFPTANARRFRSSMKALDQIVFSIIEGRRANHRDEGDLLSMLMLARDDESGEQMDDRQLRDQVLTFFIAGHETTAVALTWTWYLLASNPHCLQQVCREVDEVLGQRRPQAEDLLRLNYTRMAIEESMRLYPPVHTLVRTPTEDDEIGGYRIPSGSNVIVSQYVTHRHPGFWERPDEFNPARFEPQKVAERPKYAYFPFIGGPHQCIGAEFAMLEARLIISMLLQKFKLDLMPGQDVECQASLALLPRNPIRFVLSPRPDLNISRCQTESLANHASPSH